MTARLTGMYLVQLSVIHSLQIVPVIHDIYIIFFAMLSVTLNTF